MEKYLYLLLNVLTLAFPLAWSFERKVSYAKSWYALFPAMIITATVFLIWDQWFTVMGVWGFNERYLSGVYLWDLPLEECLFFFIVPFSTIFIYEVLNYYIEKDYFKPFAHGLTFLLIIFLMALALLHLDKWYTSVNFVFTAMVLSVHLLIFKDRLMGRFYLFYLVHLIPFLLFNGTLTGAFTPEPVVFYDNAENLGIRVFTIPIEDFVYSMGLMLMNISLFEKIRSAKTLSAPMGL